LKYRLGGETKMEGDNRYYSKNTERRFGCLQVFGLIIIAVIITAGVTIFVFRTWFFPSEFTPVTLNSAEKKALTAKLEKIDPSAAVAVSPNKNNIKSSLSESHDPDILLEPDPYNEKGLKREIELTEREINGLLASNTDLAKKLAIDLSNDLISAKLLLPIDEDFPVFGGKILRVRSGMAFTYKNGKPVVILKGITVMGVPLPNSWMGGMKDIDLVERFGTEKGFWKTFSDGIEDVKVEEGLLKIKLKE